MIKELFFHLLTRNWQRKLVAFISALAIWFLVDRSIEQESRSLEPYEQVSLQAPLHLISQPGAEVKENNDSEEEEIIELAETPSSVAP